MNTLPIQLGSHFHLDQPVSQRGAAFAATETSLVGWSDTLTLYRIPEHLRTLWWKVAASELLSNSDSQTGFSKFLTGFQEFASYKRIPLNPKMQFDVLARPPCVEEASSAAYVSVVNLGDEASVVLIDEHALTLNSGEGAWVPEALSLRPGGTLQKSEVDILFVMR